jgi:CPA1 family monovalent cation:H+ antiporter
MSVGNGAVECQHLRQPTAAPSPGDGAGCEECLRDGTSWVHLRLCLSCGHVGCCDSSPERHATRHYEQSEHAVIRSIEPGETWRWCYVDQVMG